MFNSFKSTSVKLAILLDQYTDMLLKCIEFDKNYIKKCKGNNKNSSEEEYATTRSLLYLVVSYYSSKMFLLLPSHLWKTLIQKGDKKLHIFFIDPDTNCQYFNLVNQKDREGIPAFREEEYFTSSNKLKFVQKLIAKGGKKNSNSPGIIPG